MMPLSPCCTASCRAAQLCTTTYVRPAIRLGAWRAHEPLREGVQTKNKTARRERETDVRSGSAQRCVRALPAPSVCRPPCAATAAVQSKRVFRLAHTQAPPQRGHAAGRCAARWRGIYEQCVARVVRRVEGATKATEPGSTSPRCEARRRRARRRFPAPAPAPAREGHRNLCGRGCRQAVERLWCEASARAPWGLAPR